MTEGRTETQPTPVPEEARRAGEIWGRWSWVELSVWTERMLTALENGVKGGKWYSQRWRQAFFAKQGLFSLVAAHAAASQSSRR